MAETNPNGANQYIDDPRKQLCWANYINPNSETFGNATQSAVKAGYEWAYANQITTRDWFVGKVRKLNMVGKAEKVLDETLEMDCVDENGKVDSSVLKIKQDTAKFVASTLGKEDYSTRSEQTGANGKDLIPVTLTTEEKKALKALIK